MTVERMIELLEIEKECVLRNASGECNRCCAGCDLLQDDTELHEMYTEAIALLKSQEPRVMKLEELLPFPHVDVWLEYVDKVGIASALCVTDKHNFAWYWHIWDDGKRGFTVSGLKAEDYSKTWRCWTSRPTDAQREKVKWE